MLEAQIMRALVIEDDKTGATTLMGVAQYYDDKLNFKMAYNWETLDKDWFIGTIRETIAEAFNLPVYRVDIKEDKLMHSMYQGYKWSKENKAKGSKNE